MTKDVSDSKQPENSTIHPEKFIHIIKAILLGKYFWACILFIDFLGYNPTEYIPYRTYLRVVNEKYLPGMAKLKNVGISGFDITNISSN